VKSAVVVVALLAAPFAAAQSTRCDSEIVHLTTATWDVRHLGDCGSEKTDDVLWHLDRLDSLAGQLDGKFARTPSHALVYVLDTGVENRSHGIR